MTFWQCIVVKKSRFIEGTNILDAFIMFQEVGTQKNKRSRIGEMGVQLYLDKAFDKANWVPLTSVLHALIYLRSLLLWSGLALINGPRSPFFGSRGSSARLPTSHLTYLSNVWNFLQSSLIIMRGLTSLLLSWATLVPLFPTFFMMLFCYIKLIRPIVMVFCLQYICFSLKNRS